jgi:hypothetical protein
MKSYHRYRPAEVIGVINAPDCNTEFDFTGKLAFTSCLQDVGVWNVRQGVKVTYLQWCRFASADLQL